MKPVEDLTDDEFSHRVQAAVHALPDAPEALQRRALALWPSAGAQLAAAARALTHRVVAALSFDSWAAPAVAHGMRAVRSPTRHLLYSAQGRDIDLRIAPTADAWSLAGQILGPDEQGRIELMCLPGAADPAPAPAVTQAVRGAELDAMGEFRIDGLRGGTYQLTLHLGTDRVELPPLQVGEPTV